MPVGESKPKETKWYTLPAMTVYVKYLAYSQKVKKIHK